MSGAVGWFGTRPGQWRRMVLTGLAAVFFASGCGQLAELDDDGRDLTTAPSPRAAAVVDRLRPGAPSSFHPLGGGRPPSTSACTRPASYWYSHPASWWHRELQMGATTYSKEEQLGILERAATDNGLVGVGQQLIAARLNIAAGVAPTAWRRSRPGRRPDRAADHSSARRRLASAHGHRRDRCRAGRVQRGPTPGPAPAAEPRFLVFVTSRCSSGKPSARWSSTSSCCG
jgi:hypothetical protein